MIKITYELTCDVCKATISTQGVVIDPHAARHPFAAVTMPLPSMKSVMLASNLMLCATCWAPSRKALDERIQQVIAPVRCSGFDIGCHCRLLHGHDGPCDMRLDGALQ